MVGSIVQVFHGNLDGEDFMKNTFTNNGVLVALAPGDGLLLEKVAYDRYNDSTPNKKSEVMI
jgi:tRNA U38,U39,U40 pseudouridine synthase TruA